MISSAEMSLAEMNASSRRSYPNALQDVEKRSDSFSYVKAVKDVRISLSSFALSLSFKVVKADKFTWGDKGNAWASTASIAGSLCYRVLI